MNPSPSEIREARMWAGLTQTQAARVIDKSLRTWQSWESGHRRMDSWLLRLFRVRTGQDRPESLLNDSGPSMQA
jgi:DNA-binding transcriptional regulator YiaG